MADALAPDPLTLAGWTPFRAGWCEGRMAVDWCRLGERRLTEPFFYESVALAMTRPFNMAFQRRTEAGILARLPPGLRPSGFIFHMTRCGSTLAAQILAASPRNIVVSEAAPLQAALQADRHGPAGGEACAAWFAGLVNAYGQPRHAGQARLFVKFSAADLFSLDRILRAFPDVPWLFLYRDPAEILASLARQPGDAVIRGAIPPEALGLDPADLFTLPRAGYRARCLAAFGRLALAHPRRDLGLFLRHDDLPEALLTRMTAHFGMAPDAEEAGLMRAAAARNAKRPGLAYRDDRAEKRNEGARWIVGAEAILGPVLDALDAARARA